MIRTDFISWDPVILRVKFVGMTTIDEAEQSRDFGDLIKSLGGRSFSVLCDFTQAPAMLEVVSDTFVRAQAFAVERGMLADAFVTTSDVMRMQLSRIARESGRLARLGPLKFFGDTISAMTYLRTTAADDGPETVRTRTRQMTTSVNAPTDDPPPFPPPRSLRQTRG
jgi:hypothetical protein